MQDEIETSAAAKNFTNGLGWEKLPRSMRYSNEPLVTRKSKESVTAISEDAQDLLVTYFKGSNMAASHGKRKTIQPKDMKLVRFIRKMGGLLF